MPPYRSRREHHRERSSHSPVPRVAIPLHFVRVPSPHRSSEFRQPVDGRFRRFAQDDPIFLGVENDLVTRTYPERLSHLRRHDYFRIAAQFRAYHWIPPLLHQNIKHTHGIVNRLTPPRAPSRPASPPPLDAR